MLSQLGSSTAEEVKLMLSTITKYGQHNNSLSIADYNKVIARISEGREMTSK